MSKKRFICLFMSLVLLFSCCLPNPDNVSAAKKKIKGISSTLVISDMEMLDFDIILESGRQFYMGELLLVELDAENFNRLALVKLGWEFPWKISPYLQ